MLIPETQAAIDGLKKAKTKLRSEFFKPSLSFAWRFFDSVKPM